MKKSKLIAVISLIMALALLFVSCASGNENTTDSAESDTVATAATTAAETNAPATEAKLPADRQEIKVGFLKGPTGMGAAYLLDKNEAGTSLAKYTVSLESSPDVFKASLISGDIDIAALPVNVCAVLNKKTEGKIKLLAVNTLGTLYIMSNDASIKTVADLKGKTVLSSGQGTTTEYVLGHILSENGLTVGTDVTVEYASEHAEVITKASAGDYSVILLPEPFVTQMKLADKGFSTVLDLTKEWKSLGGGELTMGAVAVRAEFAEQNPGAVAQFLADYKESVEFALNNIDEAAELIEKHGIVSKAAIAKQALPNCNLTFMTGDEMQTNVSAYLKVLYDTAPSSVGGAMPSSDFYYGTNASADAK